MFEAKRMTNLILRVLVHRPLAPILQWVPPDLQRLAKLAPLFKPNTVRLPTGRLSCSLAYSLGCRAERHEGG